MESHSTGSIEESLSEFKKAIIEAQKELPLVPDKEERDWVAERVLKVSRMKQEAWLEHRRSNGFLIGGLRLR